MHNPVEQYAVDSILIGAESHVEDTIAEDTELSDDDFEKAHRLAMAIIRGMRNHPGTVLAFAHMEEATDE